ncbi:hypothetical protein LEMA_P003290.1 [Plenodomus lingam JN3]|uniref:Uncharacterized protein n=1 Tax=Leptosphaeria maculans (strain JN3 / isolate v23.1.3 / race Av1-4-5-6-7-8) TaxID=985895 RepID=E5AEA3_LEPMJ|nr:hypothetical protein LEMA_P003290.1 [Plenodomus lingam JN3]CBY01542.1 hypothetical protein LEMA_P003290.1 [Plenodomus lingam JN3]
MVHGLLPKPLPADILVVGQLLTHPLHPERDSFYPDKAHAEVDDLNDYHIQFRYKDLFSTDTEGRFMTNYGAKFDLGKIYRQPNLLTVRAEQMVQRTSQHPSQAFEAVCNDPEARAWILDQLKANKPLYIVLGLTELKNATFKRARLQDAGASKRLAESPISRDTKVPTSLRPSTLGGLGTEPSISAIFGIDVRHVRARITTPAEPHSLDDIGYRWSYYDVPGSTNKEQLMVGLGDSLKANELRLMLDLSEEEAQGNLDAISKLSLDALSAAASPMLRPSEPALRGRSPSPHPQMLRGLK